MKKDPRMNNYDTPLESKSGERTIPQISDSLMPYVFEQMPAL